MKQWICICASFVIVGAVKATDVSTTSPTLEFATTDIYGSPLSLATFRGQWVAVNFWATWCKPCRKEIPDLDELHRNRDDIVVVGLAYEEVGPEEIQAFLKTTPASYPNALVDIFDPPAAFGMPMVFPTTVILSPTGQKVKTFTGPVTSEDIATFVDSHKG